MSTTALRPNDIALADERFAAQRRATRPNPFRFAILLTASVAAVAWFLSSVVQLSERTIVIAVIVVSFAASWIATGVRSRPQASHHRVTLVHSTRAARTG